MILVLVCILVALLIGLWLSTMALWHEAEEAAEARILHRRDVVRAWNKAARLARRNWYSSLRYSKQAANWGSARVRTAFIVLFPKSKSAFIQQDLLIGLEHGPSSYYLAHLTKTPKSKRVYGRKKTVQSESVSEATLDLSEE